MVFYSCSGQASQTHRVSLGRQEDFPFDGMIITVVGLCSIRSVEGAQISGSTYNEKHDCGYVCEHIKA